MTELRSIPALPEEVNGARVSRWSPWKAVPILSHIDPGCATCADPGPSCMAKGYAYATIKGRRVELCQWRAHRCPACDEMRIYESRPTGTGFTKQVEVLYCPPRTHAAPLSGCNPPV